MNLLVLLLVVAPDLSGTWDEEFFPRMPPTYITRITDRSYSVHFGDGSSGILEANTAAVYGWQVVKGERWYEAQLGRDTLKVYLSRRYVEREDGSSSYVLSNVIRLKRRR